MPGLMEEHGCRSYMRMIRLIHQDAGPGGPLSGAREADIDVLTTRPGARHLPVRSSRGGPALEVHVQDRIDVSATLCNGDPVGRRVFLGSAEPGAGKLFTRLEEIELEFLRKARADD
jgi:hypothetical protein